MARKIIKICDGCGDTLGEPVSMTSSDFYNTMIKRSVYPSGLDLCDSCANILDALIETGRVMLVPETNSFLVGEFKLKGFWEGVHEGE